ncbi:hypothetical protein HDU86_007900 [Geranomyces michiganensis]|nr:hypothetical protein HDU86_007900 [Geranomyces michiganensis]
MPRRTLAPSALTNVAHQRENLTSDSEAEITVAHTPHVAAMAKYDVDAEREKLVLPCADAVNNSREKPTSAPARAKGDSKVAADLLCLKGENAGLRTELERLKKGNELLRQ